MNRLSALVVVLTFSISISTGAVALRAGGALPFLRGDTNKDLRVDISDPILTLDVLFLGGEDPQCDDALDANDSGTIDLSDAVFTLTFLFNAGDDIPAPYPDCGLDPTPDDLSCALPQPGCPPPVDCLDQKDLDALVAKNVPAVTCVAPDAATIDADGIIVTVCPADRAQPNCDGEGNPGCPVIIDPVEAEIDLLTMEVQGFISGRVDGLPVTAQTGLGSIRCTLIIPQFSGVAFVPFVAEENEQGQLVVVEVLAGRLEEVDFDLEAEGGVLCGLIPAARDSFEEDLIQQIEDAANTVLEDFRSQLIGQVLCTE